MTIQKVIAFTGEKRPIEAKPKDVFFLHGEDEEFYKKYLVPHFRYFKDRFFFYDLWDDVEEILPDTDPVALIIDMHAETSCPQYYAVGIYEILAYIARKYPFLPVMVYSREPSDEAKLEELKKQFSCVKEIAILTTSNLNLLSEFLEE